MADLGDGGVHLPAARRRLHLRLLVVNLVFRRHRTACMLVWAVFGAGPRPWLRDRAVARVVNRAMATLAALTVLLFWM